MHTSADELPQHALRPITLGWALRRAAIALIILVIAISGMAWLTYASIDPMLDDDASARAGAPQHPANVTSVKLSL